MENIENIERGEDIIKMVKDLCRTIVGNPTNIWDAVRLTQVREFLDTLPNIAYHIETDRETYTLSKFIKREPWNEIRFCYEYWEFMIITLHYDSR